MRLHIGKRDIVGIVGDRYLNYILKEGRKLAKHPEKLKLCSPRCASCLAAEARSNVDEKIPDDEYKGFEWGDIYMLQARDILAEELKWIVN